MKKLLFALALLAAPAPAVADTRCNPNGCHENIRPW